MTRILEQLACPQCSGALAVHGAPVAAGGTIEAGALRCASCTMEFAIRGGVPRFAPVPEQMHDVTRRTRRMYNFTWRQFGEREVRDGWEKDSYSYLSLVPPELLSGPGRIGLEAGCGGGADLRRIASAGGVVIGFDLSDGVEVARALTRDVPGAEVVQGDLHALPFKAGSFDFIYSFGVLHHLPDTQAAFQRLSALLKPGGPLVTYLYEDRAERSWLDRVLLGFVRAARRVSSRVPPRALFAASWVLVPVVWLLFALPARLVRAVAPALGSRLPFAHTTRWAPLAADLFDRFAPAVERRFSGQQVRELYERAGFERVKSRQYRGWVSWGFKRA